MKEKLKSKVNPKFEITETVWVLSAFNTGSSLAGHSMLMLEGLEKEGIYYEPVIFQADILAAKEGASSSSSGTSENNSSRSSTSHSTTVSSSSCTGDAQGIITKVRIYSDYQSGWNYSEFQSKSWYVEPALAKQMMKSIREDQERVRKSMLVPPEADLLPFNLLGKNHPLSELDAGHNCASWVQEKLDIAGAHSSDKSKPEKVAGGCVLL